MFATFNYLYAIGNRSLSLCLVFTQNVEWAYCGMFYLSSILKFESHLLFWVHAKGEFCKTSDLKLNLGKASRTWRLHLLSRVKPICAGPWLQDQKDVSVAKNLAPLKKMKRTTTFVFSPKFESTGNAEVIKFPRESIWMTALLFLTFNFLMILNIVLIKRNETRGLASGLGGNRQLVTIFPFSN